MARWWQTDPYSILESLTEQNRKSRFRATASGTNWDASVTYNPETKVVTIRHKANGNGAFPTGNLRGTFMANGKTLPFEVTVRRWVDFFVYHGFNCEFDISELGLLRDISDLCIAISDQR